MAVTGSEPISSENLKAALGNGVRFASDEDALLYLYGKDAEFSISASANTFHITEQTCSLRGKTASVDATIEVDNVNVTERTELFVIPEGFRPRPDTEFGGVIRCSYRGAGNVSTNMAFRTENGKIYANESLKSVQTLWVDITYEADVASNVTGSEAVTLSQINEVLRRI